jgi:hypothetical protein
VERGIQVELLVHAKASSMRVILKPANCLECEAVEFWPASDFQAPEFCVMANKVYGSALRKGPEMLGAIRLDWI